ncbi:MAG: Nif3-like dinuclear metal center hexameric protein [Bacteroidales bacterium]|nr:Nif3-like dinuclear metal center hexameric protein [Bacteroidales bacterium]
MATKTEFRISDICRIIDEAFPLATQDSWDNSGLLVGNADEPVTGILIAVDIDAAALDEAISKKCNLIVAHHPIMFRGLKRLTGSNAEQRLVERAIRNGISLFAAHTCADKSCRGTSARLAQMLGLTDTRVLAPDDDSLFKLTVYVPNDYADRVKDALFDAGAGHTGNYSHCCFESTGTGSFRALDGARPFVGEIGSTHHEAEMRIDTIVPRYKIRNAISALCAAHPYEEPAYDIYPIANTSDSLGYGIVGNLPKPLSPTDFLSALRTTFNCKSIRYSEYSGTIQRVAICTGSGSEFIGKAIQSGAQAYVTADIKYHQFADCTNTLMITDIGHYESEELTKKLFMEILTEKICNFVPCFLSETQNNPVKYF